MRRFVVHVPPASADRAPLVGMIAAGVLCAAAGFFLVRWVGGTGGEEASSAVAGPLDGEDGRAPGSRTDGPGGVAGEGPSAAAGGEDDDDGEDAGASTPTVTAARDAGASAPIANANEPDEDDAGDAGASAQGAGATTSAGTPTAGRIAYVRCEVGAQNADGTWPPCPRFREIELAAARAVPRLAGCPSMPRGGRGFDIRILYRRGRPRPSLVVLPSNAPWAETVATCVRERFTGMPDGSSIDGNLTVAVRVTVDGPAGGAAGAPPPDAVEPPPEPSTPTPAAPTTPAAPARPSDPPPGAGPDGASADYRALARPRQGSIRAGAIMRAGPRDGAVLERPTGDERVEILGFDRGWVHVRWRGRTAWVFQTWTAQ